MIRVGTRRPRSTGATLAGAVVAGAVALLALSVGPVGAAHAESVRAAPGSRTVIILLDTDSSMTSALPAARQAALDYAKVLPSDVRVGLVMFGTRWDTVLRPVRNRGRLADALAQDPLTGATSTGLYAAASSAASAVDGASAGERGRLLVISDGEDLTGLVPALSVAVDVVPWHIDGEDRTGALRALASASGGHVASRTQVTALAAAFPRRPRAHAASLQPRTNPGGATFRPRWPAPLIMMLALVFAVVFMAALLIIGSLRRSDVSKDLTDRIGRYGPKHTGAPVNGEGAVARTVLGWMARILRSSNSEPGLAQRLDLAGISRKPAEWALLGVCACAVLAAVLTVVSRNVLAGIIGGTLIGWLSMRLAVSTRIARRRAAFSEQLPDLLQLIAGSLQSGFSLPQALDAVVREGGQPAASEFSRALAETRIGVDLEVALDEVADRMDSTDLRWAVMAVRIQREVGGNLAEVLRNTVGTMRERVFIRRQVRALSAEGRLSAYVLSALPPAVGGWLLIVTPKYMRPLYTTPAGLFMLTLTAILFALGVLWMRKVIKVEV